MKNNRLTARLGQLLIDAENEKIAPNVVSDLAYEMLYDADVDGLEAANLSDNMQQLAQFIEPPADNEDMTLKSIQHYLDQSMLTTVVTFANDRQINIFIQRGMIFVADCSYDELSKRIEADEVDTYESYDTVDGCDYYKSSMYVSYINTALLYLSNRFL